MKNEIIKWNRPTNKASFINGFREITMPILTEKERTQVKMLEIEKWTYVYT